jgi:CDP-glycerol glycerophosphotransferase (TagB/SpsB family)
MTSQTVFISADHGLALVYFLQTDLLPTLLKNGVQVVLLTDDGIKEQIAQKFNQPGLIVEGLRLNRAYQYFEQDHHTIQYWLHFLRWMGGSERINLEAPNGHLRQMQVEASPRAKKVLPLIRAMIWLLRRSALARRSLVNLEMNYTPNIYSDLFEKYHPNLVIASTPGWRLDRYLLREAKKRGVSNAAVIVGWDNPSSYRLSGAKVDYVSCWSEIQKQELVLGDDWLAERVHIGGIPSYDGYFRQTWLMPRPEYYALHGLDRQRKLLTYACSFVTFSPNYRNIETLARLVSTEGALAEPSQLLIRLHPNHFQKGSLYEGEANQIRRLVQNTPHIQLVEPVPLGGELGYYSGEDMPEKASMMAYADVFLTVYSTMVVETAIHDRPIVATCIDVPGGWNTPGKFSLSLREIGEWPTHQRFRNASAGRVAFDEAQLRDAINLYLCNPQTDQEKRQKFIRDECTFTDGSAGQRTGEWIVELLKANPVTQDLL